MFFIEEEVGLTEGSQNLHKSEDNLTQLCFQSTHHIRGNKVHIISDSVSTPLINFFINYFRSTEPNRDRLPIEAQGESSAEHVTRREKPQIRPLQ